MRISFPGVGTARQLPPGAEMALYRVCQESLTNVRKHAGPDPSVTVALNWELTSVRLLIKDDGRSCRCFRSRRARATGDPRARGAFWWHRFDGAAARRRISGRI